MSDLTPPPPPRTTDSTTITDPPKTTDSSTSTSTSTPDSTTPTTPAAAVAKLIVVPKDDQYLKSTLTADSLRASPFTQFHDWYRDAAAREVTQPETTTLSTAHLPSGRVSARTVYLKQLDALGFVVFSNLGTSRKARDLATNPRASLTFFWREVERQVRVEGTVERLSRRETQDYFDTRLRESRIGAWASRQSETLPGGRRDELERRVREFELRFDGVDKFPAPDAWSGLRLRPVMVEFWQGRSGRLHDRFAYTREGVDSEDWVVNRLSP